MSPLAHEPVQTKIDETLANTDWRAVLRNRYTRVAVALCEAAAMPCTPCLCSRAKAPSKCLRFRVVVKWSVSGCPPCLFACNGSTCQKEVNHDDGIYFDVRIPKATQGMLWWVANPILPRWTSHFPGTFLSVASGLLGGLR